MNEPRSRGKLSAIAGILFVLSLAGVILEVRMVTTQLGSEPVLTEADSTAELASVVLADTTAAPAKAAKPTEYECDPGQVQMVYQEKKDSESKVLIFNCYVKDKTTRKMVPSGTKGKGCVFMPEEKAKQCVVVFCPPAGMFASNKKGTCIEVNCQGQNRPQCLNKTVERSATANGTAAVIAQTFFADKAKTAAVTLNSEGVNGDEFLSRVLNPDARKEVEGQIRALEGDEAAIDKIAKIAGEGVAPCVLAKDAACTPAIQLNKNLVDAARLDACKTNPAACQGGGGGGDASERPTMRIPGGAGLPPPPLRPPQQQQQQPPASSQSFQCTSQPQPPTPCTGGTWQPQHGAGNCITGWICAPTGSPPPPAPPPAPVIALVANPSTISASSTSLLGWVTVGMQSCLISSPAQPAFTAEHANNTSVSGTARTPPLATSTPFVLTCKTAGGDTKAATTTVNVTVASSNVQESQLASAVLAQLNQRKAGTAQKEQCNPGQVQTIRSGTAGGNAKATPSTCFRNGKVDSGVARDQYCGIAKPDRCVVQYCYPKTSSRNRQFEVCQEAKCQNQSDAECFRRELARASEGPVAMLRDKAENDPNATAIKYGKNGQVDISERLTQALSKEMAEPLRESVKGTSAFDRISGFANNLEQGKPSCTNCKETVQLNKDINEAFRLAGKPPPKGPGTQAGPGTQTGPQSDNTGFKFPNITKEPSGTDVLAWMSRLFGADKPKQQPPPRPGGGGTPCISTPQPPASQCQGGSWESASPASSAESSGGNFSGSSSGSCTTNWRCVIPRIISYKAVPESVTSGETVNIGWITEGMKSCIIGSPDLPAWTEENKSYTNEDGTVKTPALTATTRFELKCTTKAGAAFPVKLLSVGVLP
ncbi:hypothetical protein HYW59_05065 [Candidatus Kaiserbacteria bacterium]|nr:hypothetical protein [Candidatus Kaiserbacteria bacterium]